MRLRGLPRKVQLARLRALAWVVLGAVSFPLGWADSVVLVWIASVYANVASEMANGEAADDTKVLKELAELREMVGRIHCGCACTKAE